MSLKDDKQRNIQMELDFSPALTGAARGVAGEETESLMATNEPENPARTNRLMEEICERENLKEALRQVKGNKGSAGVDGITVNQLPDYLKQRTSTSKLLSMPSTQRSRIAADGGQRSCAPPPTRQIMSSARLVRHSENRKVEKQIGRAGNEDRRPEREER